MGLTLTELAQRIGAELRGPDGSAELLVHRCAPLDSAGEGDLSFLVNPKYTPDLEKTAATAVIVGPGVQGNGHALLVHADPYFAFRNAVVELHGHRKHPDPEHAAATLPGVSPLAVVHPSAKIGEGTVVHPFAVVSEHVTVGKNCVIYPHTFLGPHARLGDDCQIYPQVTVYDHCVLGNRVTLHAGTVIGQDGFGYATHKGAHYKIPQVGNVVVEDDVEMGANCAIDRATVGSTVIGKGTKFSDLIAIGHGCHVGQHNLLVAQVGLAGSVETGNYVVMGGQVGVAGHLRIGHQVRVAATSGVIADVPDKTDVGGTPAVPLTEAKRLILYTHRLPDLMDRVKKLERELKTLKDSQQ